MAQTYKTRDGDVLDDVVWNYYGTRAGLAVETVLNANNGLADIGAVLPAGILITLPDLPTPAATTGVKLWD